MKKRQVKSGFFHKYSTFVGGGLLFCIALLFSGCENFLEGASIKRQIKEEIDYANSPSYEIRVECDDDTGEIITGRILSQKVTDSFNIEFKIARGAKFIGWKAYSKSTDGTLTELSSEYFTFTSIPTEDNSGIYKTSAKFLKKADAITIKPYVQILPAVKNYSPAQNSDGSYANMPVVITFNMPMEDEATQRNDSIFTYTNISLTYEGESLTNYFDAPEFNSEKTVLTLKPHERDLRDFIIGENRPNIDVKVQLSDRISVTRDGISLPLSQDENSTFMVRYKASIEEIVPAKYDFFATRDEISLEQSATQNKFTQNALGTFTDTEIFQNRTNGTIWIYGRYYDADSGVRTIRLTEKRTNNKDGSAAVAAVKTHDFTSDTENAQFADDGNGNTSFCIRYNLESDDGAILLGVTVLDACGNPSDEQTFTAIKDSGIDLSGVELYNFRGTLEEYSGFFTYDNEQKGTPIPYDEWPSIIRNVKLDAIGKNIYRDCNLPETSFKEISLSYQNETHKMTYNADGQNWSHAISGTQNISALALTLKAVDDLGNTATKQFSFPDVPSLVNLEGTPKRTNADIEYMEYTAFFSTEAPFTRTAGVREVKYLETEDGPLAPISVVDCNDYWENKLGGDTSLSMPLIFSNPEGYSYGGNKSYYATRSKCRFYFLNGLLAGDMTREISSSDTKEPDESLPPVVIKEADVAPSDDGKFLNINITIDTDSNNPWERYDNILAQFSLVDQLYAQNTKYVEKNCTSFVLSVPFTTKVYNATLFVKLTGIKETSISPDFIYPQGTCPNPKDGWYYIGWPVFEAEKFDKIQPNIRSNDEWVDERSISAMYLTFSIPERYDWMIPVLAEEYQSWIEKVIVNANGSVWTYESTELADFGGIIRFGTGANSTNGRFAIPPIWDADNELNNLSIKFYDTYNNCSEWSGTFISAKIPSFSMQSGSLISEEYSGDTLYQWRLGIAKLDTSSTTWSKHSEITTLPTSANGTNGGKIYTYSSLSLPTNTFVKIVASAALEDSVLTSNFGNSAPYYYYTGSTKNSGRYDYIIPNGKDKSTVLVASDAPTFVHTLITKHSLSSCETWTVDEWEHNHKHIGNQYMDFTGNSTAQKYRIPVSDMDSGDCYVVIAHFADGSSAMSEVMVR